MMPKDNKERQKLRKRIEALRTRLNRNIKSREDLSANIHLSQELDKLIAQYQNA